MRGAATLAAAALLAALAGPATAAVDGKTMDELVGWGSCAAVLGIYEGVLEESQGSDADRDLLARAHDAEVRMESYFNAVTDGLESGQADELRDRVMAAMLPRFSKYKDDPQGRLGLLAEFRTDLEACVEKSKALPAPAPAPVSPT